MRTNGASATGALLVLAVALQACGIYGARDPLPGEANAQVDARLIGEWTCADIKRPEELAYASFARLDQQHYSVILETGGRDSGDQPAVLRLTAFHTAVKGQQFLSLKLVSEEGAEKPYVFAMYVLNPGGTVLFKVVGDRLLPDTAASSADVLALLERNLAEPQLYDATLDCRKRN